MSPLSMFQVKKTTTTTQTRKTELTTIQKQIPQSLTTSYYICIERRRTVVNKYHYADNLLAEFGFRNALCLIEPKKAAFMTSRL